MADTASTRARFWPMFSHCRGQGRVDRRGCHRLGALARRRHRRHSGLLAPRHADRQSRCAARDLQQRRTRSDRRDPREPPGCRYPLPRETDEAAGAVTQPSRRLPRSERSMTKTAADYSIVGQEHWTRKADVNLFLWEKYLDSPETSKGTVLFVHGSSMASQPTFDLHVEGRPFSSVMDWFAVRGFDTWCVDMAGYGRSDKRRDVTCDIANGADDLAAANEYIVATRNSGPLLVYGISS